MGYFLFFLLLSHPGQKPIGWCCANLRWALNPIPACQMDFATLFSQAFFNPYNDTQCLMVTWMLWENKSLLWQALVGNTHYCSDVESNLQCLWVIPLHKSSVVQFLNRHRRLTKYHMFGMVNNHTSVQRKKATGNVRKSTIAPFQSS